MLKSKQQVHKQKNPTTRKPSLPIKRNQSIQSNASDQSCMSDRIVYKKNTILEDNTSQNSKHMQSLYENEDNKKYLHNTFENDKTYTNANNIIVVSDKSLKKIKNKLNLAPSSSNSALQNVSKTEQNLTGFQWLIILRHCFHIQNKRRSVNLVKQRTLINYIRNKMYPDSLWNKILVVENQKKLYATDIIDKIEKEGKWKLTLDDILACVGKGFATQCKELKEGEGEESAAQTARFTENMKPGMQKIMNNQVSQQNYYSQPKFIYKNPQKHKKPSLQHNVMKKSHPHSLNTLNQEKHKQVQPINITNINCFQLDQAQLGLNISPISVIDQTNDISFSLEESEQPSQIQAQLVHSRSVHSQTQSQSQSQSNFYQQQSAQQVTDRFEKGYKCIQALKTNLLLKSPSPKQEKQPLICFLEEILNYSIYKSKSKKSIKNMKNLQNSETIQYLHGLKLDGKNLSKLHPDFAQKLFSSSDFAEYFMYLHAIKICEYYSQFTLPLQLLGPSLQILNLSHNNIKSISSLKLSSSFSTSNSCSDVCSLPPCFQDLKFLNLSNNHLKNISELLALENIQELHLRNNHIDHVHGSKEHVCSQKLKIIDLANNMIQKEEELWALSYLKNINMVNLYGNPILQGGWKSIGVIGKEIVTQHAQMYVFSSFIQYKDIAFSTSRGKEQTPKQTSLSNTGPTSTSSPTPNMLSSQPQYNSQTQLQNAYRVSR